MNRLPVTTDVIVLIASAGAGLLLTYLLLSPSGSDVRDLALYLGIGGLLSLAATELLLRNRIVAGTLRLRQKMVVASAFVLAIGFINTVGLSALMFVNMDHDLPILIAILTFAGGISLYVALRLASRLSQSLETLSSGVERLSAGELSARVPVESSDEIGSVSRSVNSMAENLEQARERQRQLEESRKELTAAISHDLRTPLASARAMLEAINDRVVDDPEGQREYVKRSLGEINILSDLVNDLFELSLIDAGALTLERSQTPLQDLVLETVDGFAASARQKGLKLSVDVEEEMERVVIDGLRIRRVLVNLLQNAIKHTPPDGSVTVVARDDGDEVRVEVTDTGAGIEADDLPKIWSRFFKADESRTREIDGLPSSGLGLAIARGIIDLHGGWIEATSEKGSGARFTFGLPKTAAAV